MIPLTFGFLTFVEPLSHEITEFPETETFAEPPSAGVETVTPPPKEASVMFDPLAHPNLSTTPGPVEPAPVSAAVLPQYATSPPGW